MKHKIADLDWANLGFGYIKTPWRFIAHWKDGAWNEGELTGTTGFTFQKHLQRSTTGSSASKA